ncbi:unnamed protein product [Prorocentrum cordatum]|uniref:Uncharacterized protein n=1 Tax=Prorocentrum cordatum TaxID=2364126 RepID=A0ABN9TEU5_9DINO|nr:unnamed protein product [Polarella glacialis]
MGNVGGGGPRGAVQGRTQQLERLEKLESTVGSLQARDAGLRADDVIRAKEAKAIRESLLSLRQRLEGLPSDAGPRLDRLDDSVRSLEGRLLGGLERLESQQVLLSGRLDAHDQQEEQLRGLVREVRADLAARLDALEGPRDGDSAFAAALGEVRDRLSARLDTLEASAEDGGAERSALWAALEDVRGGLSARLDTLDSPVDAGRLSGVIEEVRDGLAERLGALERSAAARAEEIRSRLEETQQSLIARLDAVEAAGQASIVRARDIEDGVSDRLAALESARAGSSLELQELRAALDEVAEDLEDVKGRQAAGGEEASELRRGADGTVARSPVRGPCRTSWPSTAGRSQPSRRTFPS